jgi:hypothetical protein
MIEGVVWFAVVCHRGYLVRRPLSSNADLMAVGDRLIHGSFTLAVCFQERSKFDNGKAGKVAVVLGT